MAEDPFVREAGCRYGSPVFLCVPVWVGAGAEDRHVADLNFVVLAGVSTKEATRRPKASGQVKAEFSLQVDRPFMRPDGVAVSDLFLIDSWSELAEWAYNNIRIGTRVLVIGTLNKESYVTRGGGKEHLTVIKAKAMELIGPETLNENVDIDEMRKDDWSIGLVGQQIEAVSSAVETLMGDGA